MADHRPTPGPSNISNERAAARDQDRIDHQEVPSRIALPIWSRRQNSDSAAESPWARKIILSLDGGGVRGYASLLILDSLMVRVGILERQLNGGRRTPADATQGESNGAEEDIKLVNLDELHNSSAAYCWGSGLPAPHDDDPNQSASYKGCYLPHHYFDYFFGTSTGGLSAMMLGRLQMTVREAIGQYRGVATHVFTHKRKIAMNGKLGNARFKDSNLEEALQFVSERDRLDLCRRDGGQLDAPSLSKEDIERRANNIRLSNGNPHAARTVVLTYGIIGATDELRMLRSYDHGEPKHHLKGKGHHHKPLGASHLPLWSAGRATSAAPTYFSPYRIGKDVYRDGAIGEANNPVKFAYDEVRQMHSQQYPRLIISIGTGVQPKRNNSQESGALTLLFNTNTFSHLKKVFKESVLNAENMHKEFEELVEDQNERIRNQNAEHPPKAKAPERNEDERKTNDNGQKDRREMLEDQTIRYFRFNVPEEVGLTKVKLGDWHGEAGAETKDKMQDAVDQYLPQISDRLDECAELLVAVRHERQKTVRWENFALHMAYGCPETCHELSFDSRFELREHLIRDHGFVWKVPCIDRNRKTIKEWSCFWDECGEAQVSAFDTKEELEEHLKKQHKNQSPRLVTIAQLEKILDKGRTPKRPLNITPATTVSERQPSGHPTRQGTGFSQDRQPSWLTGGSRR